MTKFLLFLITLHTLVHYITTSVNPCSGNPVFSCSHSWKTTVTSLHPVIPTSVTEIDLNSNRIQVLEGGDFSLFRNLQILRLRGNQIVFINETAFRNTSIYHIDLSLNNLTSVPKFKYIGSTLLYLNLAQNFITVVDSLSNLIKIRELRLANNPMNWTQVETLEDVNKTIESLTLNGIDSTLGEPV